ncbi:hypothetical protein FQA39_LY11665 [Lamprigera yunnana]|nr:hypothetical protein FQA39_LY11665 [Lamprigera yunnana]
MIDNAPYHSAQIKRAPNNNSRKADIVSWLTDKKLTFSPDMPFIIQVDNKSGQINGIFERLRKQGIKLINVEAKINQDEKERIQVCEDLKEQKMEIVNYIEEKIKIGNGTGHNVITNYSTIEREAPKFYPSKNQYPKVYVQELQTYLEVIKKQIGNQHGQAMEDAVIREAMKRETETWYRTKVGEYRNFKQFRKVLIKNYWGTKEESVMKSELYGTKYSHSLRQLEEELLSKVRSIEVKKFVEVVTILEIDTLSVWNDGNEYYNHYNNYEQRKDNYSDHGRNNHNYSLGPYQWNQFYHHKNRNSRSCGRTVNINKIIQQPKKKCRHDRRDSLDDKEKEICLYKIFRFYQQKMNVLHQYKQEMGKVETFVGYFVARNLEPAVLKKNVGIEMIIINGNVDKDADNDNIYEGNGIKEIVDMRKIMKGENV